MSMYLNGPREQLHSAKEVSGRMRPGTPSRPRVKGGGEAPTDGNNGGPSLNQEAGKPNGPGEERTKSRLAHTPGSDIAIMQSGRLFIIED